jgi:hypothetical protein
MREFLQAGIYMGLFGTSITGMRLWYITQYRCEWYMDRPVVRKTAWIFFAVMVSFTTLICILSFWLKI